MTSFAKLAIGANVKCASNSASGGLTMTMRPLFKPSLLTSKDSKWRWVTTLNQILVSHQTHVARERYNLSVLAKDMKKVIWQKTLKTRFSLSSPPWSSSAASPPPPFSSWSCIGWSMAVSTYQPYADGGLFSPKSYGALLACCCFLVLCGTICCCFSVLSVTDVIWEGSKKEPTWLVINNYYWNWCTLHMSNGCTWAATQLFPPLRLEMSTCPCIWQFLPRPSWTMRDRTILRFRGKNTQGLWNCIPQF